MPSEYPVKPITSSAISRPAPFNAKKIRYSRVSPAFARCLNVHTRFPAYEKVVATTAEIVFASSGPSPALPCSIAAPPRSSPAPIVPMTPNLASSWMNPAKRRYTTVIGLTPQESATAWSAAPRATRKA